MSTKYPSDPEKGTPTSDSHLSNNTRRENETVPIESSSRTRKFLHAFESTLVKYNLEARGIERVLPEESKPLTWRGYLQAYVLWVSINLAAVNITLGMLAPTIFGLGFKDAALCAVFGSFMGSLPVAYVATWGPVSGNRTMVRILGLSRTMSGGTDSNTDILEIYNGLVAEQIDCVTQFDCIVGLLIDRLCGCGADAIRGISQREYVSRCW